MLCGRLPALPRVFTQNIYPHHHKTTPLPAHAPRDSLLAPVAARRAARKSAAARTCALARRGAAGGVSARVCGGAGAGAAAVPGSWGVTGAEHPQCRTGRRGGVGKPAVSHPRAVSRRRRRSCPCRRFDWVLGLFCGVFSGRGCVDGGFGDCWGRWGGVRVPGAAASRCVPSPHRNTQSQTLTTVRRRVSATHPHRAPPHPLAAPARHIHHSPAPAPTPCRETCGGVCVRCVCAYR